MIDDSYRNLLAQIASMYYQRELTQNEIAKQLGIPPENIAVVENGTPLELTAATLEVQPRMKGGYVFVDGTGVGDVGPILLKERDRLAGDGFVIVVVPLTRDHHLSAPPQIITRGFIFLPEATNLLSDISERVMEVLDRYPLTQEDDLESELREQIEDYIYQETQRRPMVIPVLARSYFA